MSKNVLITGATGFVGGHLVRACLERGWKVRAYVLPGDPAIGKLDHDLVEVFRGDICDLDAVQQAAENIQIIFHCASIVSDWAPDLLFRGVITDGTENVCKAARKARVERLVHISTNDVFGMVEYRIVNETMPLKPWNEPYPDYKILAEEVVWKYHQEGLAATMVYPCWVYGEGDMTFVPLLADAILRREMVFWRKDVLVWPTYIENLVDLLMLISENDRAVGEGYLVHDGNHTTLQRFSARIADAFKVKPPKLHIPYGLAMAAAVVMEFVWRLFKFKSRPLLTTYAVKNLGSRFRYSIHKAEAELGWKPAISHEEGMRKTMAWLKQLDRSKLKTK